MTTFKPNTAEQDIQEVIENLSRYMVNDCPSSWMEEEIAANVVYIIQGFPHDQPRQKKLVQEFITGSRKWASKFRIPSVREDIESAIWYIIYWLDHPLDFEAWLRKKYQSLHRQRDEEFDCFPDIEQETTPRFWQSTTIERNADNEGKLETPITKEQVLTAIRQQNRDSEKYPPIEDIEMEDNISYWGMYDIKVKSNRGTELARFWAVPPPN